jgi:hypothetical protein
MNSQQVAALTLVAVCAVYLGRQAYASIKDFFSNKSEGCGTGCGKCAFAQQRGSKPGRAGSSQTIKLIPLESVQWRTMTNAQVRNQEE